MNADGRNVTPCSITTLTVILGPFCIEHSFSVVVHLSVPAILGCDFLRKHKFVLSFESGTYYRVDSQNQALPLQLAELRSCTTITIDEDCPRAILVKCDGKDQIQLEMAIAVHPEPRPVAQEFEELYKYIFSTQLGQANVTKKHQSKHHLDKFL